MGFHDQHLRKLDNAYPKSQLTARGNRLKVLGPEEDREELKDIVKELVDIASRNGKLSDQDIDTVLALKQEHREVEQPTHVLEQDESGSKQKSENHILYTYSGDSVTAKTPGQQRLVDRVKQDDMVFAIGPAGTGKTYTSVALAVKALKERKVKKIVLARPAVEAGEQLGFLPGDLKEKVDPYLRPLYDALEEMIDYERLELNMAKNIIEIAPLAYMRGRTLNNAFVILDEAQNATNAQMKMFLTRIGFNSQAIITGDVTQTDLPKRKNSGLVCIQDILKGINGISFVYLDQKDVVRHKLVRDIIQAYEEYEEKE